MMPPRQGWEALQERLLFLPPLPEQLDPLALFALLLVAGLLAGETLFRSFGLSHVTTDTVLAAMGYESRYGVRSLKRTLMDNVEEPLSTLIIDGKLHEGDTVVVESDKSHGVKLRVA